ncbi:PBECR2 nuclease fold domain-containing protein [Phyllobacterium leguminum]|uniref:Phage Mu protein F like protein n=1 Tax=Phyllobacterium leguminum TaxID=314237 RepID=A0A318SZW8_9HYPH|nr:PBECR2 nuclease fold domain-containing protein [Phyllobacterium leguminum]PYE87515.1 phage Mu protein F like protein [Phyllobacterium leguminum]
MAGGHFTRRLSAIRAALDAAADLPAAARAVLQLAATWTPAALGKLLADGLELAALHGREAVYQDGEDEASFADADVFNQPFREQIDYLRQKRGKITKVWTDAMRGVHDRGFVIAGATDLAMLSDFQTAIADAIEKGRTIEDFRADFDRIVAKYGWQYKGERGWRTRVIFETNVRTSYMAGRLKQMRDPDILKLRPIWEYRHGETRTPRSPRPQHEAWHGLCLPHDDPFWETHFPPNGWLCTCGVRSRSMRDLKRLGKDKPDAAPVELMEPIIDPMTGKLIEQPQGIGYGWDYMPGDLWERGLTPSSLMDEGRELLDNPRMAVEIDITEPLEDLLKKAKPFSAKPLEEGLQPEDYVRAFLKPFGADIGKAVLFEDKAGTKIPISDRLFRDRKGDLKVGKGHRATVTRLLAEALMDPDEIWLGVARKKDPVDKAVEELIVDRRYIRADPENGLMIVFEIGERLWEETTAYNTGEIGKPNLKGIDLRRGGKLIYKRPE